MNEGQVQQDFDADVAVTEDKVGKTVYVAAEPVPRTS